MFCCNLPLKLEVVLLLESSALEEFQSVTLRGKKLYLNTSDLTAGGTKWWQSIDLVWRVDVLR